MPRSTPSMGTPVVRGPRDCTTRTGPQPEATSIVGSRSRPCSRSVHLLGVYPARRRSPRDVRLLRRPERAADAAAPSGEPLAAPLTAHPFALQNIRLGKAVPTPASIGREVELRILACRPIPGMILRHRLVTHHLDVRRAVVPRRDGPSDRVGQAVG